jgi:hypothetical protein
MQIVTQLEIESNHGKAAYFVEYERYNFNFVRFGGELDKIYDHFQAFEMNPDLIFNFFKLLLYRHLHNFRIKVSIFDQNLIVLSGWKYFNNFPVKQAFPCLN